MIILAGVDSAVLFFFLNPVSVVSLETRRLSYYNV